jgi:hypothetical protein
MHRMTVFLGFVIASAGCSHRSYAPAAHTFAGPAPTPAAAPATREDPLLTSVLQMLEARRRGEHIQSASFLADNLGAAMGRNTQAERDAETQHSIEAFDERERFIDEKYRSAREVVESRSRSAP